MCNGHDGFDRFDNLPVVLYPHSAGFFKFPILIAVNFGEALVSGIELSNEIYRTGGG